MTKTFQHGDRLLMMRQVREIVPYSRTHIYRLINAGTFPKPIKLQSNGRVCWLERDVHQFISERI
jgi:prophage regulatory protein